jgi:hypothetical protein
MTEWRDAKETAFGSTFEFHFGSSMAVCFGFSIAACFVVFVIFCLEPFIAVGLGFLIADNADLMRSSVFSDLLLRLLSDFSWSLVAFVGRRATAGGALVKRLSAKGFAATGSGSEK